jgi:hypothetical protein
MEHITQHGPTIRVSWTEPVKATPINGSKMEFFGEGYVTITTKDKLVPIALSKSTPGITGLVVEENQLTIIRGKDEISYQIVDGDRRKHRLLPNVERNSKGLVS